MSEINTEPQIKYDQIEIDINLNASPDKLATEFSSLALECNRQKWTNPTISPWVRRDQESVSLTLHYSRLETPEETQIRIQKEKELERKQQLEKDLKQQTANKYKQARINRVKLEMKRLEHELLMLEKIT